MWNGQNVVFVRRLLLTRTTVSKKIAVRYCVVNLLATRIVMANTLFVKKKILSILP